MSVRENQIVASEDPVDREVPRRGWITVTNLMEGREIRVILEINGRKKELFKSSTFGIEDNNILQSHNLSGYFAKVRRDALREAAALVRNHGGSKTVQERILALADNPEYEAARFVVKGDT